MDGSGTECLSDVGHRTTHRGQEGLPAIVEQMPSVRDLHCVRKSPGNGAAVTAIAVAGHNLDPGVAAQPSLDRGRFAVRKNVDDPPPFRIADQGSVPRRCGYLAMGGQIVDATLVSAPKQRNSDGEKAKIKAGKSASEI